MSVEEDWRYEYHLWCDRHAPHCDGELIYVAPISLDSMDMMPRAEKKAFCEEVLRAYGLKRGTRITEKFARDFFASFTKISGQKS